MNFIKVIGVGSPFGEDRTGWMVAERLKQRISTQPCLNKYVKVEWHDRPGIRLIELMHETKIVFLIDAVKSGNKLGTIHRLKNSEIQEFKSLFSTHHVGIAQTLQLASALKVLPENIILYGIEIDNLEFHSTLSESVEAAINEVVVKINKEIIDLIIMIHGIDIKEYPINFTTAKNLG